ncbi:hypothetical protein C8R46DRAFT_184053 [Mycena filopes]|nr:hypothetical protein C8R46DRAFT_184053 [Mycena filopes]
MSTVDAPLAGLYELLKSQLYAGAAALFFHGICLLLFSFAVFYLLQTRTPANRIFLILAVVLMLFALAQAILDVLIAAEMSKLVQGLFVSGDASQALSLEQAWARMYIAREGLFAFNNAISDGILLYRCSVIWSTSQYHRYVLGGSSLLILATFILGMYATFLSPTDTPAPYILALLTNFVLLLLSAGRIWRKGRQAAVVLGLGEEQRRRYNGVVEIICESSLLYVLNVVIYLIADAVRKTAYQMMRVFFVAHNSPRMGRPRASRQHSADDDHGSRRDGQVRLPLPFFHHRAPVHASIHQNLLRRQQ